MNWLNVGWVGGMLDRLERCWVGCKDVGWIGGILGGLEGC